LKYVIYLRMFYRRDCGEAPSPNKPLLLIITYNTPSHILQGRMGHMAEL
jgi:hypothetical protein